MQGIKDQSAIGFIANQFYYKQLDELAKSLDNFDKGTTTSDEVALAYATLLRGVEQINLDLPDDEKFLIPELDTNLEASLKTILNIPRLELEPTYKDRASIDMFYFLDFLLDMYLDNINILQNNPTVPISIQNVPLDSTAGPSGVIRRTKPIKVFNADNKKTPAEDPALTRLYKGMLQTKPGILRK